MAKLAKNVRYTPEFRKEVLAFSDSHGIPEAAHKFGVPRGTLNVWRTKKVRRSIETGKPMPNTHKGQRIVRAARKAPLFTPQNNITNDAYRDGFRDGFHLALSIERPE